MATIGLGYSNVSDKGFIAFTSDLKEGAWGAIKTQKWEGEGGSLKDPLGTPIDAACKIRLHASLGALKLAMGAISAQDEDDAWDAAQRRLYHSVALALDDPDPEVRRSAKLVLDKLTQGNGTAQTGLVWDAEVDFGRTQKVTATEPAVAAALKKLKLGPVLAEIDTATESLAKAIGRQSKVQRKAKRSPSKQVRDAITGCVAAFNGVHDQLGWLRDRAPDGADRKSLEALLVPLENLLARFPAVVATAANDGSAQPSAPAPLAATGTKA